MNLPKKRLLSGVKPTNKLTLGNYLGAIKNWGRMQDEYDCLFPVVDLHSITVPHDPSTLTDNTFFALASYMASGINQEKSILFVQSHVMEHTFLSWLLNCHSTMGELNRMTQFKDKSKKSGMNIPAGLFTYPVLMAADILLYDIEIVPVGEDQIQHVELTRNIAQRMNQRYGDDTFILPKPVTPTFGARIMDLQNPTSKMGKSDSEVNGVIYLSDSDKTIEQKIKRAVTDSGTVVEYSDEKPGVKNLLTIQASILNKNPLELANQYAGKMYGHLKVETAEIVVSEIRPIREEINRLLSDKEELLKVLKVGQGKAQKLAMATLERVNKKLGLITLLD